MWFSLARKTRRNQTTRSRPNSFRPQFDALEDRCLMSAGALDPTFGSGGIVSGGPVAYGTVNVLQPNGKIVVGGEYTNSTGSPYWGLARYNSNGTLDSSFGTNGVVGLVSANFSGFVTALALQSNGDIVAAGYAPVSTEIEIARFTSNGSFDTTFGSGKKPTGYVVTSLGSGAYGDPTAVAIQVNGKIDVAVADPVVTGSTIYLVQYTANGAVDTTFGPGRNGIVSTPNAIAYAMALQPDGKILVAGSSGSTMFVGRYTTTGQLDSSFGSGGIAAGLAPPGATTAGAKGILVLGNGTIVIDGYSGTGSPTSLTMARLTSSGQLDATFGSAGFAFNSTLRYGYQMAQSANGDFLLASLGGVYPTYYFNVAAFLPGGAVDATFATGGIATVDVPGQTDYSFGLAIQNDGKILVPGFSVAGPGGIATFNMIRLQPPDTKIGSFTATPNPVPVNTSVTLSASGILNANPTTTITQVAFYLDANGDGTLEPGFDTLLGYGTNVGGVWSFSFIPTTSGTFTLFALGTDSNGVVSDPVAVTLTVI